MARQIEHAKDLAKSWGQNVRTRRNQLGLSQRQLAELCGIRQQSLGYIEAGNGVSDSMKILLCQNLGAQRDDLFPWPPMEELQVTA